MKRLYIIFWALVGVALIVVSLISRDQGEAMVAEVESQVTAVSFQKPVIVKNLAVVPGQDIKAGDLLVEVSQPDLELDIQKKLNEKDRLLTEISRAKANHSTKQTLLRIETQDKITRLKADKAALRTEMAQSKNISEKLKVTSYKDSVDILKIQAMEHEIATLQTYFQNESERSNLLLKLDLEMLEQELDILEKELSVLEAEKNALMRYAKFDGIVGTVSVQLDELVPPYTTLISIFEERPSMIKAYMNERVKYPIQVGDKVRVESENRQYSVPGEVIEIGSRITDYPTKLQNNSPVVFYGQEVFIRIPKENNFLKGEKVFVYYGKKHVK